MTRDKAMEDDSNNNKLFFKDCNKDGTNSAFLIYFIFLMVHHNQIGWHLHDRDKKYKRWKERQSQKMETNPKDWKRG